MLLYLHAAKCLYNNRICFISLIWIMNITDYLEIICLLPATNYSVLFLFMPKLQPNYMCILKSIM